MRGGSPFRFAAAALAALALPGCAAVQKFNPLLLIDDPLPARAEPEAAQPRPEQVEPDAEFANNRQPQGRADKTAEEEAQLAAAAPASTPPRPSRAARDDEDAADNSQLVQAASQLGMSVVGALPAPDAPQASMPRAMPSREFTRFYEYALAQIEDPSPRQSALLLDPPSIDPAVKPCGDKPSAVLVDLDPSAGLLPLAGESRPDPALAGLLGTLRDRGVTVFWISGHGPEAASAIRGILDETALDPTGEDPLILMRFAGESKQKRRVALADTHCLLAIAGDQRADFDELYDHVIDPVMAAPLEVLVGNGWFLTPPPID